MIRAPGSGGRPRTRRAAVWRHVLPFVSMFLLTGCREMADAFQAWVERVLLLLMIGFGLAMLACIGTLGMTISAFRTKAPKTRLVVSTALGVVAVVASTACIFVLDTLGFIEALFVVFPIPAVVWALLTWGEFADHRASTPANAPGSTFRVAGFLASLAYLAIMLVLVWNEHGRPSWSEMFPRVVREPDRPTMKIGEPIEELHTRGAPSVGLTRSGRMLLLEGTRARVQAVKQTSIVTGDDAGVCGLSSDGEVSCVGAFKFNLPKRADALALSSVAVCHVPVGLSTLACATPAAAKVDVPDARRVLMLALIRERLFVLGADNVVLEFDAETGKPSPLRLEKIRSIFTGGGTACFIGLAGDLRCQHRGEVRNIAVPFSATSGAVTDYVGCVIGDAGELACWSEFSRADTATIVPLDGRASALWPGNTFSNTIKVAPDRFFSVKSDLRAEPISLPSDVYEP